ncbi:DUF2993 domain-containing protein [Gordonia sinesedis]
MNDDSGTPTDPTGRRSQDPDPNTNDSTAPGPNPQSADQADQAGSEWSGVPQAVGPQTGDPQTGNPQAGDPQTGGPQAGASDRPLDPATQQFDAAPTDPAPRAYSQVPRTDTATFATGTHPAGVGTGASTAVDGGPLPPPTGGQPVVTAPSKKRGRGRTIALVSVGIVLLLIIGLIGSELYLRKRATDCLEQQFSALTGTSTDVSLSRQPVLWQSLRDEYPFVQIDTDDSQPDAMRLHARGEGIGQSGEDLTVQSLTASGYLPFSRVTQMSAEAGGSGTGGTDNGNGTGGTGVVPNATIGSMTGNPADGTVEVETSVQVAIFPIPVGVTIKPVVDNGKVRFEVVKANALIFGIPNDYAQQVVDGVTKSMFGPLFDQTQVTDLTVTDGGVDFALRGSDMNITQTVQQQASSDSSCSLA